MRKLSVYDFKENIFDLLRKGAVLTAGTVEKYNAMTIAWGTLGLLWGKNVMTVFVRPSRYTYQFMKDCTYFTVSFFGPSFKNDVQILGTLSGRNQDKIAKTVLKPVAIKEDIITFLQARITFVCKKVYEDDLKIKETLDKDILRYYQPRDYHDVFVGEITDIYIQDEVN